MRVLVACEESQRVCIAFRKLGHEAYSCDVIECSGGHPEWHIQDDVLKHLRGGWDLIIAHPPCTYLSNAGAARLFRNVHDGDFQMVNVERLKNGIMGRDLFMAILNADCGRIAIENPIPSGIYCLPKPTQAIQPYQFGDPYTKKTYLWLKGLPPLIPTEIVEPLGPWVCGNTKVWQRQAANGVVYGKEKSAKHRSKTFPGVANAMAAQWGTL